MLFEDLKVLKEVIYFVYERFVGEVYIPTFITDNP